MLCFTPLNSFKKTSVDRSRGLVVEGGEPLSRDHEFKYHRTLDQYSSLKCLERHEKE